MNQYPPQQPQFQQPYQNQPQQYNSPGSSGKFPVLYIVLGIMGALLVACVICAGVLFALLRPAVQSARAAGSRISCANNLEEIGLGIHGYLDVHRTLPPAYTVDEQGRRLHSWRTLILPHMGQEQQALYKRIDLKKPWDDPVNQKVAAAGNSVYQCPSSIANGKMTSYLAIVDPEAAMTGSTPVKIGEVRDGTSNTIFVVEVPQSMAVNWMSPEDIDIEGYINLPKPTSHPTGHNTLMGDASVLFQANSLSPEESRAYATKNGGD